MNNGKFPPVLDACCGGKRMWFDKCDSRAVFLDARVETLQLDKRRGRGPVVVDPNIVGDFTDLPFPDKTFRLVVFDPPHRTTLTSESDGKTWLAQTYGRLLGDWKSTLQRGLSECFRVLQIGGVLVFKWCEYDVPISEVLSLTSEKPLFGHRSGKQSKTHWITFIKDTNISPKPNTIGVHSSTLAR